MKRYRVDVYLFDKLAYTTILEANNKEELVESLESNIEYEFMEV